MLEIWTFLRTDCFDTVAVVPQPVLLPNFWKNLLLVEWTNQVEYRDGLVLMRYNP